MVLLLFHSGYFASITPRLIADAGDAGEGGRVDVPGVRDAVGGEVGGAERELVGLQRGE